MWPLFIISALTLVAAQDAQQPRAQRWAVFGEPFDQRVVSLVPGTLPWSGPPSQGWTPPASLGPWAAPLLSLPTTSPSPYPWPPAPPMQSPTPFLSLPPASLGPYPWPPAPPMQSPTPFLSLPPASLGPYPWSPIQSAAPSWSSALQSPFSWPTDEYSSRDLDVGVYTGLDSPWTRLPPFSRMSQARGPLTWQPFESSSRDLDVGVYTGDDVVPHQAPTWSPNQAPTWSPNQAPTWSPNQAPTWSPNQAPTWSPNQAPTWSPNQTPTWSSNQTPYNPWMRQQGGFAVRRAEDDLKLTMHVPKDGLPGGVLVMEMKASVYRPVY